MTEDLKQNSFAQLYMDCSPLKLLCNSEHCVYVYVAYY